MNNRKIYKWALIAFVIGLKDTLMGIILASGIVVGAGCANAKPWGKTSGYYDSRGMPTASLTGGATDLPLGTQTFGFIDVATDKKELDNVQDPYMEISLAKKVILEGFGEGVGKVFEKSVGPIVEYNRDFIFDGFHFTVRMDEIRKNYLIREYKTGSSLPGEMALKHFTQFAFYSLAFCCFAKS